MKKVLKKSLALILALTMLFGAAPLAGLVGIELPSIKEVFADKADAATGTYGVLSYEINNGEVFITDCDTSASGELEIPGSIEGYPVTKIGDWAFEDCTSLTSIIIPDSVTSIGNGAFSETGIYNDESNWENGVLYIGNHLIEAKTTLEGDYTIKSGTKTIADRAFFNCTNLLSITIPKSVTSIGSSAFEACSSLASVTIPDSVKIIGSEAFFWCESLTSITIPDSVKIIGSEAFSCCTSLASITVDEGNLNYSNDEYGVLFNKDKTELVQYPVGNARAKYTIPDSVTGIGYCAFYNCTSLTNITIPDSVTSIGEYAFEHCESLKSITFGEYSKLESIGAFAFSYCLSLTGIAIPDYVTSISDCAFYSCTSLASITVDESNPNYSNDEYGVLFNKDKTELIQYPVGNARVEYTIPDSVTIIDSMSFWNCKNLTSITIPDSVTNIDNVAFRECTSLTSITIPNSVTSIGRVVFSGCSSLTNVSIPDSVTSIGSYAFEDCTSLTSVTIPDSVTSIDRYAFSGCTSLTSATIPNSVTSIGYDAFYDTGIYNDESNWKNGVLYIGNHLIEAEETVAGDYTIKSGTKTIADRAFFKCESLANITIPAGVTSIGNSVFRNCSNLTSITIPDSVTSIGGSAFYGCTSLTSLTIPVGVTSIGENVFENCTGLSSVTIPDSVTGIGYCAFYNCTNLTNITIPDSVTSIGDRAFSWCTELTSVTIGKSVTRIGSSAFYNTGLYNDSTNWENGVLYIGNYLIKADSTISGAYTIKSGTKAIADDAFHNCTGLTSITIPDSVTSIGNNAFNNCDGLTGVTIPDSVTSIGSSVFWGCTGLTSVTIGNGVTSIGSGAFEYCNGLTNVRIGNSVTSIGSCAFENCYGLTSITIPSGVTSIGEYAFSDCTGLTNITIPDSVTSIGHDAFRDCTELTSITIPDRVTTIGDDAFLGCARLTSVTIPDSVTNIGKYAFSYCTGLTSVTIPNSVTSIDYSAFRGCTALADVYYAGSEDEWNAISISSNNENLTNATIHFNSSGGGTTPEIPVSQNIKVMTYNVYCENKTISGYNNGKKYDCSYDNRVRYIVQSIYDNMPDSIGMQEVTKDMRPYLENYEDLNGGILSANYAGVGEYRSFSDKGNNEASLIYYNKNKFNLISSGTFWLSESGLEYSKHSGADYQRICTYALLENKGNGLRYLHVNTHLEHDHSSKPGGTNDAAVSSSEKIIDFIEKKFPNIPAVITGDFNQTSSSVPYKNFIDAGYSDTRKIYSENKNTYTNCFNQGGNGSLYAPKVIDHILVNKYFANGIKSYTVYDENYSNKSKYGEFALDYPYPSDHNPVIAELEATYSGDTYLSKNIDFKLGEKSGKVEVVFKDEWFEKSNENYNHSLAQFCSDYVMMGYCYNESEITNYLSQMGFGNVDSNMNTGRDEVNYFIASKDINVNGNKETLVFAAFIGSWHDQWYSNFDPLGTERANWSDRNAPYASGTTDHLGFADAREYVYAKLKTYIKNLKVDKENIKLLLSGHSRGAATANLLAAKLIDDGINNLSNSFVKDENIYTYTFATPNTTSNKDCLSERYSSIFNIVNPEDFVTKVLPNDWGFQRYGNTFILPSKTNDSNNKAYLKAMNVYYNRFTSGGEYKPYSTGEMSTVKMLKEITSNVDNVNDFYNKYFYASDLFNNELFSKNYSKANPFEFFKYSLLDFLSEKNKIGAVSTILTIISNPFSKFYKDILLYFFEFDLLDSSLNPSISIKFAQAHGMETYAAYMNSMTSSQIRQPRLYFENTVNCPVDIEVYDNNTNELIGKITDNSIDETVAAGENAIAMDVDGDSKSFWLPSNGNYRVVLVGNDEGKMDYTVSNVNSDTGEIERLNFFDVNIENDVSMHGDFSSSDFALEDYALTHDTMGTINPTQRILDMENENNISIDTSCEGNGIVDGSFKAISGDYVTVSAYANEGGCFTGWFENGKLVSKEKEYSFVAKNSRNLTARFADFSIKTPSTATISYGDSIILHADINGTLPEGARIEWTASNGNFSMSVSADGTTCKISPKKSGDTTITVKIFDASDKEIGFDTQTMTAKAGLWQKIVAFFKKIFGLTKTFPEAFKGIL